MRTIAPLSALLFAALLVSTGCTELNTEIEITGSLVAGECGEILPWSPPFATWTDTGEADAMLRIQSLPGPSSSAEDTIVFIINDKAALADAVETPIVVGDREYGGAQASGHVTLPVRCPDQKSLAIQLFGELQFEDVSGKHGQRIVGAFIGQALNPRDEEVLGESVTIRFDFPHRFQTPWQSYPTRRN